MKKAWLYKFFEGTASLEEEKAIREWLDASAEHRQILLKERKLFDAMLLWGADVKTPGQDVRNESLKSRSSLRTFAI